MQKIAKGRRLGEDHQNAILSNHEIEQLRRLREDDGLTYDKLADKFEISKSAVAKICQYNRR